MYPTSGPAFTDSFWWLTVSEYLADLLFCRSEKSKVYFHKMYTFTCHINSNTIKFVTKKPESDPNSSSTKYVVYVFCPFILPYFMFFTMSMYKGRFKIGSSVEKFIATTKEYNREKKKQCCQM